MRKKYILMLGLVLVVLTACAEKEEKPKEEFVLEEEVASPEENSSSQTLVEDEKTSQAIKAQLDQLLVDQEYLNYHLDQVKVLSYKGEKGKLSQISLFLRLDNEDPKEGKALVEESAQLIEKAISQDYTYEKLEINWETSYSEEGEMIMYIN